MDGIGVIDGTGVTDGIGVGLDGTVGVGFTSFATTAAAAESAIVAVINKGETFFKNVIILLRQ